MAEPTKQQTEQVFRVLQAKRLTGYVSTAVHGILPGQVSLLAFIFASNAPVYIAIWAFISASCGLSTNLDSWQLNQLRNMKIGGNASATEFFTKHGGTSLLSDHDSKKKYSSKIGELYKEELARRVKEDAARFPNGIYVEGMEPVVAAPKEENEEDFFTSWSKPNTPKSSQPGTPRVATPPVIGRPLSAASGANVAPSPVTSPVTTTSTPRTLTSSSAARPGRLGTGNSRLGSASSTGSTGSAVKKSKLGLGASKAKPVNFAEVERKAREEEERIKQLGYDRQREEAEERARKEADALKLSSAVKSQMSISSTPSTASSSTNKFASTPDPKKSAAFPRLGFGAIPGAGAAAAVSATAASSNGKQRTPIIDDAPTTAREKFGGQKAISSDMYFGRGNYDADQTREAQTRLQSFQGATSISSNQYFGREDEEGVNREDPEGGLLGDGSLSGLESAAKDAISRVMANPDVQNVGESLRAGALKLSDYLASMSER